MAAPRLPSARPTFLQGDSVLARAAQPFVRFLHVEAAGGILLVAATIAALAWANSPWDAGYESLWATNIRVEIGSYLFAADLAHLVNDLLMAVFFFVVGMEIKRELVVGELRDRRSVALPAMAALGGMIVPAAIYVAFNAGGDGARGWGIPMATDIAFALGVVALLGSRVPGSVKVLLLTLAIVDDIGAIAVIAVFYTDSLEPALLLVALGLAVLVAVMHRAHVVYRPLLAIMGLALWLMVYESGVHATIAGVVMGLLTPARGSVSACDRLIDALHPWTSYVVVPVFALANAGIVLSADAVTDPSATLAGVAVALVVGKLVGIASFSWFAVRFGLGRLPEGARWGHILGVASVAGIGFTVSLFITGLAFDSPELQDDAKVGTLAASVVAAITGAVVLTATARGDARRASS
jgi:Na+:H+ antiporter, NhaA family